MSILKRLFGGGGGGSAPEAPPETYRDCTILPAPAPEGGRFRLQARIEKDVDGETRSHTLIRADVFDSRDAAAEAAVRKAKQVIDEQGDALFRR